MWAENREQLPFAHLNPVILSEAYFSGVEWTCICFSLITRHSSCHPKPDPQHASANNQAPLLSV